MAILLALGLLLNSAPALAANSSVPSTTDQQLKTQLLKVRHEQKVSKVRINKNIAQVKNNIRVVKKHRLVIKHKRVMLKKKVLGKVKK